MSTGHFTQVVWVGTTHVGLSASNCGNFIFANYFPAGNMQGSFERNVFPANTKLSLENLKIDASEEKHEDSETEERDVRKTIKAKSMTAELKTVKQSLKVVFLNG